jgi:hypothetical protein
MQYSVLYPLHYWKHILSIKNRFQNYHILRRNPARYTATKSQVGSMQQSQPKLDLQLAARGSAFTIYQTSYALLSHCKRRLLRNTNKTTHSTIQHQIAPRPLILLRSYPIQAIWNEQNWQHHTKIPYITNHRWLPLLAHHKCAQHNCYAYQYWMKWAAIDQRHGYTDTFP